MTQNYQEAQCPLILRCHRIMESFAKANDERDFYLDRLEGFLFYVDLDKTQDELDALDLELKTSPSRYCQIPKLTFYETKKIMEGFVNEKVYDIDTKEKLLDIIHSRDARENFLEFIYDHHAEYEKWQQYYQERSRIRIIEWLRQNHFQFVFEEDLDLAKNIVEKVKLTIFQPKANKEVLATRKLLFAKAKTYYSNEALNPRPKRGRPPKQALKPEVEPQMTADIYLSVPAVVRPFLFTPEYTSASAFAFSSKFDSEGDLLASRKQQEGERSIPIEEFQSKLASLRTLSSHWLQSSPSKNVENTESDASSEQPKSKQKKSPKENAKISPTKAKKK